MRRGQKPTDTRHARPYDPAQPPVTWKQGKPKPPGWFSDRHVGVWTDIVDGLGDNTKLAQIDTYGLQMLVHSYIAFLDARDVGDAKTADQHEKTFRAWADRFAMHPKGRAGSKRNVSHEAKDTRFDTINLIA